MANNQQQLDRMFHALADGNRRAMIDRLSRSETRVSDFAGQLGVSLPTIMQHVAVLEGAGLVTTKKVGRVRTCTLDTTALSQAERWISERRAFWNHKLDALGDFLEHEETSND